jgi:hypothetical protein
MATKAAGSTFDNLPEGTLAVLHHMVLDTAEVLGRVS